MKFATSAAAALLLALPAGSAMAQQGSVEIERPEAADTASPNAAPQAGEMGLGRQYGRPAGDALATPANPAAVARQNDRTNAPGLNVNPDMLGGQPGAVADPARNPEYRIVDEPPMRRLNDAGTGATSAKIGIGERRTGADADGDVGAAERGMGDGSYSTPPDFDPAGDPAPPALADGPVWTEPRTERVR